MGSRHLIRKSCTDEMLFRSTQNVHAKSPARSPNNASAARGWYIPLTWMWDHPDTRTTFNSGHPSSTRLLFGSFVPVMLMLSGAEEMPCRKPGHLLSQVRADSDRVSVVHSAINPGVEHFRQMHLRGDHKFGQG